MPKSLHSIKQSPSAVCPLSVRLDLINYGTDFNAVSSIDRVIQEEGFTYRTSRYVQRDRNSILIASYYYQDLY